jgi:hypothetical protein
VAHETSEQRLARYKTYFDEMDAKEHGEIKSAGETETEIQETESETAGGDQRPTTLDSVRSNMREGVGY